MEEIMVQLLILVAFVGYCTAANLAYSNNYNVLPQNRYVQRYQTNPVINTVRTYNSQSFSNVPMHLTYRVTPNVRNIAAQGNRNFEIIKAVEYNPFATNRNTVTRTNTVQNQVAGPAEQTETLIYLLSKQPDIADLVKRFRDIQVSAIRQPEVRFIKYRTPEDIQRIQAEIKSQYDNSPELVKNINGLGAALSAQVGAPISSLTHRTSATSDDELYTAKQSPFLPTGVDVVPGSSYLPPSRST